MASLEQLLARAHAATGHGTVYWIGTGGRDPNAALPSAPTSVGAIWPGLPADKKAEFAPLAQAAGIDVNDPTLLVQACDCSGFVLWALGMERQASGGAWINTDTIWADAKGPQRHFQHIIPARPGALVVYPMAGSHENFGHIGIVIEADAQGRATLVAHCSADNFGTAPNDAIKITDAHKFEAQGASIYVWCRAVA